MATGLIASEWEREQDRELKPGTRLPSVEKWVTRASAAPMDRVRKAVLP